MQYTSVSTGAPRGGMRCHANLVHYTAQIARGFEIDADSRGLIWLPPFHDMGLIGGILQGIACGFPTTLMPPVAFLQRPRRWLEAITRTRATISGGPSFAYQLCLDRVPAEEREGLDLSSWRVAFNGAEPVRPETLRHFAEAVEPHGFRSEAFYPCYGLAEATLMVAGGSRSAAPVTLAVDPDDLAHGRVAEVAAEVPTARMLVGCGHAIADQRIVIVDPATREPCPPDQVGEIWVAGPSVALGYWDNAEATEETFGAYLEDGTAGPFLRTGELGFLRDGELFVTGRIKALLILAGRNVHAEDVEASVGGGVAFSVDEGGEERLVVVKEVDRRATNERLDAAVKHVRLRVAEDHQLSLWAVALVRVGSIPRTSSGKVQRSVCRDSFLDGSLDTLRLWRASRG